MHLFLSVRTDEVRNKTEQRATNNLSVFPICVCVCLLQEFQDEIAPIQDDVTHMNQLASTFGPPDIHLSPSNLERIEDLNTRWRLLQVHCHAYKHTRLFRYGNTPLQTCMLNILYISAFRHTSLSTKCGKLMPGDGCTHLIFKYLNVASCFKS